MRSMFYAVTAALVVVATPAAASTTITGNGFSIPALAPFLTQGNNSSSALSFDLGNVTGLTLTLTNLSHSFVGNLRFTLSHGGTDFVFADFNAVNSARGDNFSSNYVINDTAATLFTAAPGSPNVTAGTYRSATSFASAFGGDSAFGFWTLSINDLQATDVGSLGSWTLGINTGAVTAAVPEPATWALMIAGFGAVGASLRRRKVRAVATV